MRYEKICVAVLIGFGLISVLSFRNGFIFAGFDFDLSFMNISMAMYRGFYTWAEYQGLGLNGSPSISSIFPDYTFLYLIQNLGVSIEGSQKIEFLVLLIAPSLAMFFMVRTFLDDEKYIPVAFFAALFYFFNFFELITTYHNFVIKLQLAYVMIPIILAILYKIMKNGILANFPVLSAISLFNSGVGANISLIAIEIMLCLTFILFVYITRRDKFPNIKSSLFFF